MTLRLVLAFALAPAVAAAQPIMPNGSVPDAPHTLDPGAAQPSYTPPAPQQAPAPAKPNVIVVGPDGKPTYTPDQDANAPSGYYVGSGGEGEPSNEPTEIHAGPVPELHVVRRGDTLWDICTYYFNDPWQWPKVWSYNPQITNPHWIYPGDLVRLLPRGMFAAHEPEPKPEGPTEIKPPDNVPPPQQHVEVGLKQTAFVEKSDLDKSIELDGSVDEKELLAQGDQVYLRYPDGKAPEVGKTYSIYVPDNPVKSNGKDVGAYVHLLGTVEVVSVKQDKRARGVIRTANQEIERHSKVGPLIKQYKTVPPVAPQVDARGSIVAILTPALLIGQGELAFIDLGKGSGVEVGNRMFVVRRGDAYPNQSKETIGQNDERYPARALGEVVIVQVGDNISVGLVTLAVQEMGVGDVVMMQKAK
ncbi:MAG TPA: LysM peptidoglycan-binding domain-containing protein [Kofleriaceae bacterium]|jgi:hypothetical protein